MTVGSGVDSLPSRELIASIIEHIGHFLPSQGPVKTFVHHNTLHYFENEQFFDALDHAGDVFDANRGLAETTYQEFYASGRIDQGDLNRILSDFGFCHEDWLFGCSRRKFVRSLLLSAPIPLTAETLRWRLLERGYLRHFHEDVSGKKRAHIKAHDTSVPPTVLREWLDTYTHVVSEWHQEWLHEMVDVHDLEVRQPHQWTDVESLKLLWIAAIEFAHDVLVVKRDFGANHKTAPGRIAVEELVNPYLIKFTSSFLDAGLAHLTIADKSKGLLPAFLAHMSNLSFARPSWLKGDISQYEGRSASEILASIMEKSGLPRSQWERYLLAKALVLKGWGGLVLQSERGMDGIPARATLAEFMAVRLILEDIAEGYIAEHPTYIDPSGQDGVFELTQPGLADLADEATRIRTTAYHLYHAFQLIPAAGSELLCLPDEVKQEMVRIICRFDTPERVKVWHQAFEWNLYARTAAAITNRNADRLMESNRAPICQMVCCIDDREESFRRYLEEIHPEYETFGTAGFFGVDAEFHSLYERPAAYCPVNVVPTHMVEVRAREGAEERLLGLQKVKTLQSDVEMFIETKSRSLLRGWLLALGGIVALIPLSLSTLAPRWMHRFRLYLTRALVNPSDESAIVFAEDDGELEEGGFTLDEMAHRVKTLLLSTGLSKRLAPLVVVMGHGSFSTNNPYRSAYDCGACGGRPGRLNSRVFAAMANRRDVRAKVRELGIDIPETTDFLGAFHNTCTDGVEYFDVDAISGANKKIFDTFRADVEIARSQNALERCRRFDDAEVKTVAQAIAHVESRAHHIAQPRPEYGHATNALCIVGRREITKGLFLDRRAFLVSYDKTVDGDLTAIRGLLRAVIPVCMGINLEYFFSALDNQKYGAGTKLPHNVTSLLGLMTGYCSDLRTGLPAQMVEIHEPTRVLVVLDLEPQRVVDLIETEADLRRVVQNRWISLMAYASDENAMYFYSSRGVFEKFEDPAPSLRLVPTSLDWVVGKKGHLDFVKVGR
jgi:uncharacterized protein YbcC (UPF0753/DUF2309 family)